MLDHPYFYEEQARLQNWELLKVDKEAWKWNHAKRKPQMNVLAFLFDLVKVAR